MNDLPLIAGWHHKEEKFQVADPPDELDLLGTQLHEDDVDPFKMEPPCVVGESQNDDNKSDVQPQPPDQPQGEAGLGQAEDQSQDGNSLVPPDVTPDDVLQAEANSEDVAKANLQTKVADLQQFHIVNLPIAIPLTRRKTNHVVETVATLYSKLHGPHIPIAKVHTDRAKEFISKR